MSQRTTVRVQIILEVTDSGSWNGEHTFNQVNRQATEEARNKVLKVLLDAKTNNIKMIGVVKVIQVQAEEAE
jgi:hypothetical protein